MPNQIYHSGYPIGSVDYVPKSFKRRGAFIRYTSAKNVIWLFKPDVESYFAQQIDKTRAVIGSSLRPGDPEWQGRGRSYVEPVWEE